MRGIAQEAVAGVKKKASAYEEAKPDRTKTSLAKCQAELGLLAN